RPATRPPAAHPAAPLLHALVRGPIAARARTGRDARGQRRPTLVSARIVEARRARPRHRRERVSLQRACTFRRRACTDARPLLAREGTGDRGTRSRARPERPPDAARSGLERARAPAP